jgi:hypothetical protein
MGVPIFRYQKLGGSTRVLLVKALQSPATLVPPMPPKKKSKTTKVAKKSPCALYFERLSAAMEKYEQGLGMMLVRGVKRGEDEDEDDEDEDDEDDEDEEARNDKYTEEQVSHMRHIVITKRRADALEEMEKLILGEQANESFMTFNTSFSYEILDSFGDFFSLLNKKKSAGEKLDYLFAYTYTLNAHDVWAHDHEVGWGGHKPLAKLAKTWKDVLANDNEAVDIVEGDGFTRAGIEEMLEQFKKMVEDIEQVDEPDIKFKYA